MLANEWWGLAFVFLLVSVVAKLKNLSMFSAIASIYYILITLITLNYGKYTDLNANDWS